MTFWYQTSPLICLRSAFRICSSSVDLLWPIYSIRLVGAGIVAIHPCIHLFIFSCLSRSQWKTGRSGWIIRDRHLVNCAFYLRSSKAVRLLDFSVFYRFIIKNICPPAERTAWWWLCVLMVSSKVRNASSPKHRLQSRMNLFLGFKIFVQFLWTCVIELASVV